MTQQSFKTGSQESTVVGNWSLEIVWSFPQLAQVTNRAWSLRGYLLVLYLKIQPLYNQSACKVIYGSIGLNKTRYVESHDESKCALWICIRNGDLKDIIFYKRKMMEQGEICKIYLFHWELSPTSCWLIYYRLWIQLGRLLLSRSSHHPVKDVALITNQFETNKSAVWEQLLIELRLFVMEWFGCL